MSKPSKLKTDFNNDDERVAYINELLRTYFDLWIHQDTDGMWHEGLSLDKHDNWYEAAMYAFEYGLDLMSGINLGGHDELG